MCLLLYLTLYLLLRFQLPTSTLNASYIQEPYTSSLYFTHVDRWKPSFKSLANCFSFMHMLSACLLWKNSLMASQRNSCSYCYMMANTLLTLGLMKLAMWKIINNSKFALSKPKKPKFDWMLCYSWSGLKTCMIYVAGLYSCAVTAFTWFYIIIMLIFQAFHLQIHFWAW